MLQVYYDSMYDTYKILFSPQQMAMSISAEQLFKYSDNIEGVAAEIALEFAKLVRKQVFEGIVELVANGEIAFNLKANADKWYNYFNSGIIPDADHTPGTTIVAELKEIFPGLDTKDVSCPECSKTNQNLAALIIHLNDVEKWSRESIADFLEESDYNIQLKE